MKEHYDFSKGRKYLATPLANSERIGVMIYERLKDLCIKRGTSPTALCVKVTGNKGNLATWQKGNIRSDYLIAITEEFGVTADYLLTGQEPQQHTADGAALVVPSEFSKILMASTDGEDDATQEEVDELVNYWNNIVLPRRKKRQGG